MQDKIEINRTQDVALVRFGLSSICAGNDVDEISQTLRSYVSRNHPPTIVIDFTNVRFFSSQVLGLLVDLWKKLKTFGGLLIISGIDPQLYRVFRITNLDKIFSFAPDSQAALDMISKN
jgi:anti-sigma B factor antagonist